MGCAPAGWLAKGLLAAWPALSYAIGVPGAPHEACAIGLPVARPLGGNSLSRCFIALALRVGMEAQWLYS